MNGKKKSNESNWLKLRKMMHIAPTIASATNNFENVLGLTTSGLYAWLLTLRLKGSLAWTVNLNKNIFENIKARGRR